MKIYSTIDVNRHWFFNKSLENILGKKTLLINFKNLFFKLLLNRKKSALIIDSGLIEKLLILFIAGKNVNVIIHGEAGFGNYKKNFKKRIYFILFNFLIHNTNCKVIFVSRYLKKRFNSKNNFYYLEHPGFFINGNKIKAENIINSVGSISSEKSINNYLNNVDFILNKKDFHINHFGSFFINSKIYNNIKFNGFVKNQVNLKIFSQSKFIFLLNNSQYINIVSGVVIQSIYNLCVIITHSKYPEIIDFYEKLFNVKIHISLQNFLKLKNPNIFYESKSKELTSLRKKLNNLSLNDSNKIF